MIVGQNMWKETGYGTIIFLAALSGVDVQLYEAAEVDGANRWQKMWHITLPAIKSTIVIMLILKVGSILNTGYEQIFLMQNSMNRTVSDYGTGSEPAGKGGRRIRLLLNREMRRT